MEIASAESRSGHTPYLDHSFPARSSGERYDSLDTLLFFGFAA
jgi:hypothetical protein